MKFSFVVLTWNRYRFLQKCLDALLRSIDDLSQCEIVVLDNGSNDLTKNVLRRYQSHRSFRVIASNRNEGLNGYKELFETSSGEFIVEVDDDVLDFPEHIDRTFADYLESFPDFGYIALNVVQNEFTNGARPGLEEYSEETREGRTILRGPTGGWCACFRRDDYRQIRKEFLSADLHMGYPEDSFLAAMFEDRLRLKSGIIKDALCLHASGPYYAKHYGHLDREIEKYANSNLDLFVEDYERFRQDDQVDSEDSTGRS